MFTECTIQYDTKKGGGDIYVFVEKQILVLPDALLNCNIFYGEWIHLQGK